MHTSWYAFKTQKYDHQNDLSVSFYYWTCSVLVGCWNIFNICERTSIFKQDIWTFSYGTHTHARTHGKDNDDANWNHLKHKCTQNHGKVVACTIAARQDPEWWLQNMNCCSGAPYLIIIKPFRYLFFFFSLSTWQKQKTIVHPLTPDKKLETALQKKKKPSAPVQENNIHYWHWCLRLN